jgi:outer membrane assembly lipoprotein YfiO
MPKRPGGFLVLQLIILGLCAATHAQEQQTSELRGGRWVDIPNPATQIAADPELERIERLVRNNENSAARKALVSWFKTNHGSPLFDRALYLMATTLYQSGDRVRAFYYLDELMDEYPDSNLYYAALEKQYQIADAFLDGYKRRLLGIPMLGAHDEAIDMLFRIQQRSPGSPLAEKSLLRTADYYYFDGQYDLAADAYNFYVKQYPRSPLIPPVRLRQAFANYAQFRGVRFDANPLVEARTQLMEIIAAYPQLAAEEQIPTFVQRIDDAFAGKLYVTADFYRRTHSERAAVYLYRYLTQAYPASAESKKAEIALAKMPQWALESPPPGAPMEPATTNPISTSSVQ